MTQKVYFSRLIRVYVGLLLSRFPCFFWWFGTFLQLSALASPCSANYKQYKQQANPLLSLHNYAPLVIKGNDKKEAAKLALTAKNTLFALWNQWIPYNLKNGPVPYLGLKLPHMSSKAKSISWDSPFKLLVSLSDGGGTLRLWESNSVPERQVGLLPGLAEPGPRAQQGGLLPQHGVRLLPGQHGCRPGTGQQGLRLRVYRVQVLSRWRHAG